MQKPFILLSKPSVPQLIGAVISILAILALLKFRVLTHFATSYAGGFEGDAGIYVWLLKMPLLKQGWFNTTAFYPYGQTLAWSDNFLLPALFARIVFLFTTNDAIVFNTTILAAQFLNGFTTFYLLFSLTRNWICSVGAGLVFMSLSWFDSNLGHPQLQFVFFIPLGVWSFFYFFSAPSFQRALIHGIVVGLAFLTTIYYAIFLAFLYLVLLLGLYLLKPHSFSKDALFPLVVSGAFTSVLFSPFILPYLNVQKNFGTRNLYEAEKFSATLTSYLSATPWSRLYSVTSSLSHSEAYLFAGFALLLGIGAVVKLLLEARPVRDSIYILMISFCWLIGFYFLSDLLIGGHLLFTATLWISLFSFCYFLYSLGCEEIKRFHSYLSNRSILSLFLFCAFVFLFLSQGPLTEKGDGESWSVSLYTLLAKAPLGLSAIRAVGRAGIVSLFFLVCVYSLSIWYFSNRRRILKPVLILLFVLPILENQTFTYPLDKKVARPQIVSAFEKSKSQEALLALPYATDLNDNLMIKNWSLFAARNVTFMNWFSDKGVSIINGYSGQQSKVMKDLPQKILNFPDERSIAYLSQFGGLTKIAVFPKFFIGFDSEEFEHQVKQYSDSLQILTKDDEGNYLLSFSPKSALSKNFELLFPPWAKKVSFKLSGGSGEISVLVSDPVIEKPLRSVQFNPTHAEEEITLLELPPGDTLRPYRLSFGGDNLDSATISGISFR